MVSEFDRSSRIGTDIENSGIRAAVEESLLAASSDLLVAYHDVVCILFDHGIAGSTKRRLLGSSRFLWGRRLFRSYGFFWCGGLLGCGGLLRSDRLICVWLSILLRV